MSAAPPPRASAKAPRPITARCPGLRRFGHPATLPLRWMPDRMRADVLALRDIIRHRPFAGVGFALAVLGAISLTTYVVAGPQNHTQVATLIAPKDHAKYTIR